MSSRRTRKNNRRSNRSRTQRSLNPLAPPYPPEPTRKFLTPVKSAERLIKKAGDLINEGKKFPKPTPMKILPLKKRLKHKKIKNDLNMDKIIDEANKELKRQQNLMPKPPSQPQSRKTQKLRPGRTILKKKPKTSSPSKSKSNTQSRRTIVPKPPSKSQNKGQGSSRPQPRKTLRRNRTILTNSQNPQGNRRSERLKDKRKKRNLMQKIKKDFAVQIENMEKPFKAAKTRKRRKRKPYNAQSM